MDAKDAADMADQFRSSNRPTERSAVFTDIRIQAKAGRYSTVLYKIPSNEIVEELLEREYQIIPIPGTNSIFISWGVANYNLPKPVSPKNEAIMLPFNKIYYWIDKKWTQLKQK